MNTATKAGIGIGGAVGAIIVAVLLWVATAFCARKYRKKVLKPDDQIRPSSLEYSDGFAQKNKTADEDPRSPTWSGHKSELPAEEARSPRLPGHKSELPADESEARTPAPSYEPYHDSYRSPAIPGFHGSLNIGGSTVSEIEGSPGLVGLLRRDRAGVHELPG